MGEVAPPKGQLASSIGQGSLPHCRAGVASDPNVPLECRARPRTFGFDRRRWRSRGDSSRVAIISASTPVERRARAIQSASTPVEPRARALQTRARAVRLAGKRVHLAVAQGEQAAEPARPGVRAAHLAVSSASRSGEAARASGGRFRDREFVRGLLAACFASLSDANTARASDFAQVASPCASVAGAETPVTSSRRARAAAFTEPMNRSAERRVILPRGRALAPVC